MTLSCDASGNPMPTTFSWTVNGSAVTVGGRISFSQDDKQLTITNVTRGDSGQYRCVATNSVGNVTSNAATLNVQCKNTFTSYLCPTKMVGMPNIRSASRLVIFPVFCLAGISLLIFAIDFPPCCAPVAERSAMRCRPLEEMARN